MIMRMRFHRMRRVRAVSCTLSLLAVGALLILGSERLLAQNQKELSDPCRVIAAVSEETVSCASDARTLDNGFRVEQFQDFDLPNKAKIAFATIFNARAAKEAQVFNFTPLNDEMEEGPAIEAIKKGIAYPAIAIGNGEYYVFRAGALVRDEDWTRLWGLLVEGAKSGKFSQIGIAAQSEDLLPEKQEQIFGWGGGYGLVLPVKE